jgi:hypothetical protein
LTRSTVRIQLVKLWFGTKYDLSKVWFSAVDVVIFLPSLTVRFHRFKDKSRANTAGGVRMVVSVLKNRFMARKNANKFLAARTIRSI